MDGGLGLDQFFCFLHKPAGDHEFVSGSSRGLEGDRDLSSNSGNAKAEGELCHGLIEQGRQDAAVDDSHESLVVVPGHEGCRDGPVFRVDLEGDLQSGGIPRAADITTVVVAQVQ